MSDIFQKGQVIVAHQPIQISTIKIYEEDIFESDLSYFWRLVSLGSITKSIQEPIQQPVIEKTTEIDEWKELEKKIEEMEVKEEKKTYNIDELIEEYRQIVTNLSKELTRLSNLYRMETSNSKKQILINRIKMLKTYSKTEDPKIIIDYILEQKGIMDEKIRSEMLARLGNVVKENVKENVEVDMYKNIIENMEKIPEASLFLYLIKNDPETFRKYSLKQIDKKEALLKAKYYYLKQKNVPEHIIKAYLDDNYK